MKIFLDIAAVYIVVWSALLFFGWMIKLIGWVIVPMLVGVIVLTWALVRTIEVWEE